MDTHRMVDVNALLDSSATGMFIDKKFVEGNRIAMRELERPIRVYNVDGTLNQGGSITHEVTLMLSHGGHKEKATFEVCDLGKSTVIIGYTWLQKHNPEINWKTGDVKFTRCPRECNVAVSKKRRRKMDKFRYKASEENTVDEDGEYLNPAIHEEILATIRFLEKEKDKKVEKTSAELVPPAYHAYLDVFEKKPSERMPLNKPWDHAIDLVPDFVPREHKLYQLSPTEQEEVSSFIDEQLRKGYIRPSKSPMTSPIFFVPKKDGKKRMCQDYRYLNSKTIKNNCPLPLIPEIIDKIGNAKVFTKMDLRWGYNNVRIKIGRASCRERVSPYV